MEDLPRRAILTCFLASMLIVFAAAHVAVSLPPAAVALIGLLLLLRIGWLEDNISQDLLDRDRMPASYVNTARRRQRMAWYVLSRRPGRDPAGDCPALLATRMRAEVQGHWAALIAATAAGVAHGMPAGFALSMTMGAGLLVLALWRADHMALSLLHLEAGHPLTRERLLARSGWVNSYQDPPDR